MKTRKGYWLQAREYVSRTFLLVELLFEELEEKMWQLLFLDNIVGNPKWDYAGKILSS